MPPNTFPGSPAKPRMLFPVLIGRDPTITMLSALAFTAAVIFTFLAPTRFVSADTFRAMAFEMPELGILALAMMVPLMSGGLNLAIIATANASGLTMAAVLAGMIQPSSPPLVVYGLIAVALFVGMATALGIGLITGIIVAYLRVHPILVTLGTMTAVKGIAVLATRGGVVSGFPPSILFVGNGTFLGIPVSMILFIGCAIVVGTIISYTPFGVSVRMLGSNEKATRYSGVRTQRTLVGVYILSSLLCWIAAIIMMGRFNSARAGYAESYLLITILAAVLGGVDPFGGFGRVLGLLLALVLLQVVSTGFNLLGLSTHLTEAIWGVTMILAILIARIRELWTAQRWISKPQIDT